MAFSLLDKLRGNSFSKEFNLGKDLKVSIRTLTAREDAEIVARFPNLDLMTFSNLCRIPTLARAIEKVNGVPFESSTDILQDLAERKVENPHATFFTSAEVVLGKFPVTTIAQLYSFYLELLLAHRDELEGLKKSSKTLSPDTSGN